MKGQTLKENKDFRRVYYRGKSQASSVLVTYAMKNRRGSNYYGVTTGKKIGGAVERNRARRIIRVAFNNLEKEIDGSWDFVFVARSKTVFVKEQDVERAMRYHLVNIGAINEED
ncbi:MAG TPA: ribonuclease P protein component [Ruminococcaceae bacterium]|nr:ribonuclease P protein component [Oscillospiraceae bacterium]